MELIVRGVLRVVLVSFFLGGFAAHGGHLLKGVFTGYLTDARTNEPLTGANVYLSDIKAGATTDARGYFEIRNVPEGKHLVEISHVGFATIVEYVLVDGVTQKNFTLTEAVVENNSAIGTGVTGSTQLKRA